MPPCAWPVSSLSLTSSVLSDGRGRGDEEREEVEKIAKGPAPGRKGPRARRLPCGSGLVEGLLIWQRHAGGKRRDEVRAALGQTGWTEMRSSANCRMLNVGA